MSGPEVLEIKRTLDGREQTFRCTLLARTPEWLAVRFVTTRPATVSTLALPVGTETVGHFWDDRPYTAYHWLDSSGWTLGIYLNAAAEIEIRSHEVRWLDLALDVLVWPDGRVDVLDEDEAQRAPDWAHPLITRARTGLDGRAAAIAAEVAAQTRIARSPIAGEMRAS
jgi:predicted RNA-binding protein associated with RNAse of E/G family